MVRLAINGFGRIGRAAFKIALQDKDVDVVAINDLGDVNNLAYLLRHDTVYGPYSLAVTVRDTTLVVGDKEIAVLQEKDPTKLPWGDWNVDVVIESTGVFTTAAKAQQHLTAGAKQVIISAPTASDQVATVVIGVNDVAQGQDIISNASCTTNCVTPVAALMNDTFGVVHGLMTTIHAYTATQVLVDGPSPKDWRRGRAGAMNIVPSSTGAAEAVTKALPALAGKFDGVSLRVPVMDVSLTDFTFVVKQKVTVESINEAFKAAVDNPRYKGVMAVTDEPVVSSDFIGDPHSAIVDLGLTRVVGETLVKVMAWYDNEWGYANRLVEQVKAYASAHNGRTPA